MNQEQKIFLALDCGGTKCRARLTDEAGNILGEGVAGPANAYLGLKVAFDEILAAAQKALRLANIENYPLKMLHVGIGMAGLTSKRLLHEMDSYGHLFASFCAVTDAHTAQLGAFNGGDGAILISGTGSCGYAVIGERIVIKGGYGFNVSDHGCGAHLGRNAIRRSLQGFEGILPYTAMCKEVMAKFENSIETLVDWADTAKPVDYGQFAPIVFFHAEKDGLAAELIRQTAREIDLMIKSLIEEGAPAVALVGGMAEPLMPWLSESSKSNLHKRSGDALDGARILALRNVMELEGNADV